MSTLKRKLADIVEARIDVVVADRNGQQSLIQAPLLDVAKLTYFQGLALDGETAVDMIAQDVSPRHVTADSFKQVLKLLATHDFDIKKVLCSVLDLVKALVFLGALPGLLEIIDEQLSHCLADLTLCCIQNPENDEHYIEFTIADLRETLDGISVAADANIMSVAGWCMLQFWRFLDQHNLCQSRQQLTSHMVWPKGQLKWVGDAKWSERVVGLITDPFVSVEGKKQLQDRVTTAPPFRAVSSVLPEMSLSLDDVAKDDTGEKLPGGEGVLH
eukprot:jgi/Chrzof1/2853/Cz12g01090.t1